MFKDYYVLVLLASLASSIPRPVLAQAACEAPAAWFPHATTPEPDFHQPGSNCEFHQWAWQEFLWLTQADANGRIRLLSLPTAEMLFSPGRAPAPLETEMVKRQLKSQILRLAPRVIKQKDPTSISVIHQATTRGVVVDQNGRPIFYTSFVSPEYYEFVRTTKLYLKANYQAASNNLNFPKKAVELKSSWRVVSPGESADGFFTTKAMVPKLLCKDGAGNCTGDNVGVDMTNQEEVTVALVGLHVVGVLEGHPEFVWSTFEHMKNAPDLPAGVPINSPNPVSAEGFTFYRANTAAKDCNVENTTTLSLDVAAQKLSPVTEVFRQFAFGGGDSGDTANIKSLNASVHDQLDAASIWKNYMLVGGVWFANGDDLVPGLNGTQMQQFAVASLQLSNSTMETFSQNPPGNGQSNCFSCHSTRNVQSLGAKNLNISHILRQGLIDREELPRLAAMNLSLKNLESMQEMGFNVARVGAIQESPLWSRPENAAAITSFAQVKELLDKFVADNNIPISFAPHRAFWRTMTHDQFVNGNLPNVTNPDTGEPLKILVVGNADASNLIMSLRGTPGTLFDPDTGLIGRMPPSGPFMADDDIQRVAAWINAGAPE
jgi:hypothetical protein